jgi:hypothetical protein
MSDVGFPGDAVLSTTRGHLPLDDLRALTGVGLYGRDAWDGTTASMTAVTEKAGAYPLIIRFAEGALTIGADHLVVVDGKGAIPAHAVEKGDGVFVDESYHAHLDGWTPDDPAERRHGIGRMHVVGVSRSRRKLALAAPVTIGDTYFVNGVLVHRTMALTTDEG